MSKLVERFGLLVGFLSAVLTEDSPPSPPPAASGSYDVNVGSYRTARLTAYRPEARELAENVFKSAAARLSAGTARRHKGSYTFLSPSSGETLAKIVIYERGVGRVSHDFPIDHDGVYILLRAHGASTHPTIGVAPHYEERFTYRRVGEADADTAAQDIVTAVEQGIICLHRDT